MFGYRLKLQVVTAKLYSHAVNHYPSPFPWLERKFIERKPKLINIGVAMVDCNESDYTRPGVEFEHVCNKVLKYLVGLKISIS